MKRAVTDSNPDLDGLWARWNDTKARRDRDAICLAGQATVHWVAQSLRPPKWVNERDLVSYGQIGLLQAIDAYKPGGTAKFHTFAVHRIRGAILDGCRDTDWVPRRVRRDARDLEGVEAELHHKLHRSPTDDEVAGAMGRTADGAIVTPAMVAKIRQRQIDALVTSTTISAALMDDDGYTDTEMPGDDGADSAMGVDRMRDALEYAIRQVVDPVQQQVLRLYYVEQLTMAQVARQIGMSAAKVSGLRDQAIRIIQANLATAV